VCMVERDGVRGVGFEVVGGHKTPRAWHFLIWKGE